MFSATGHAEVAATDDDPPDDDDDTGDARSEGGVAPVEFEPITVVVCRSIDGAVEFHSTGVTARRTRQLPACQTDDGAWIATDSSTTYVVVDETDDYGTLTAYRNGAPDQLWRLDEDVERDHWLQDLPGTAPCSAPTADLIDESPEPEATDVESGWFTSPTGNIGCLMTTDQVRCDVIDHEWELDEDVPCDLDFGDSLGLFVDRAVPLCVGDTVLGGEVLVYGDSRTVGPFTCSSAVQGVTCSSTSGARLFVSRERYITQDAAG